MPTSTITQDLENLSQNFLIAILYKTRESSEIFQMIKYFLKRSDATVVYTTLDKPSKIIKEELIENKISTENFYFVDLISEVAGAKPEITDALFSGSPSNLTELSITLNSAMKNLKTKNKFILFDTFSTLFNYNPQPVALKFFHYLATTMRNLNVSGIFIIIKNQLDERTLTFISGVVDKTIEI